MTQANVPLDNWSAHAFYALGAAYARQNIDELQRLDREAVSQKLTAVFEWEGWLESQSLGSRDYHMGLTHSDKAREAFIAGAWASLSR